MGLKALQKDLREGMSIEEGLKKHNMTLKEIFNQKENENKLSISNSQKGTIRKTNCTPPHYGVCKMINGKLHWFGVYPTKKEAQIIREHLHQVNWDINELEEILKETGIKRILQTDRKIEGNTYIYSNNYGHYTISKIFTKNGKKKSISGGTYTTQNEARIIRDELIKNNWDISNLDEICKKHHIIRRKQKGGK